MLSQAGKEIDCELTTMGQPFVCVLLITFKFIMWDTIAKKQQEQEVLVQLSMINFD